MQLSDGMPYTFCLAMQSVEQYNSAYVVNCRLCHKYGFNEGINNHLTVCFFTSPTELTKPNVSSSAFLTSPCRRL